MIARMFRSCIKRMFHSKEKKGKVLKYMSTYMYLFILYVYMEACMFIEICTHIYEYVYTYIYVHICAYTY
jgi:hypothetical protein